MIKQLIPEGFCLKCQGCCRFREQSSVWAPCLLDEEIQNLLDREDIPAATLSMERRLGLILDPKQEGFICPFFNTKDNKCTVYSFRPFECQLYPFLISFRSDKVLLTVDLSCPYAKENINTKAFKEYTGYLTGFLNSPKQRKVFKENPQIIQAYAEVFDLMELQALDEAE
ncbi:MAG: YkgJ family cysteine cluster protein [Candidatus Omnitrophota bacterium]